MQRNVTSFDTGRHHIHLELSVTDLKGLKHSVAGILDTGAPKTEFSDQFLIHTDFIDSAAEAVIKPGMQTQKYGVISLPSLIICGHKIDCFDVFVSRFEKSWGIDALIGLDFFRRFLVTVDFLNGFLIR
ncbi:MAG: hypothetical protein GY754_27670 [bacterium]|nr:hypothetical protein [bacterium]